MRGGNAVGLASDGQLGASQAGVRLYYEPGPAGFVLTTRLSTPLQTLAGSEASAGIGYRSRFGGVFVERRFAIGKNGRNAMSLTTFAGVDGVRLPVGLELNAYAQAGVVGAKSRDAFVDGALQIERRLLQADNLQLNAGVGTWGGVQPGVARLDIGPQLVARIPVVGRAMRISGEWRQRIAGNANPASGPTVSIGFDL